jgi:hypothetical protein
MPHTLISCIQIMSYHESNVTSHIVDNVKTHSTRWFLTLDEHLVAKVELNLVYERCGGGDGLYLDQIWPSSSPYLHSYLHCMRSPIELHMRCGLIVLWFYNWLIANITSINNGVVSLMKFRRIEIDPNRGCSHFPRTFRSSYEYLIQYVHIHKWRFSCALNGALPSNCVDCSTYKDSHIPSTQPYLF